jgi:hypothetical protein
MPYDTFKNVSGKATVWHIPCWIWEENVETQYVMHEVWKWFCNNDRHNYSNNTHMRSKEGT